MNLFLDYKILSSFICFSVKYSLEKSNRIYYLIKINKENKFNIKNGFKFN